MRGKGSWIIIMVMLIGLVIGTVIGGYCSGISALSWLDYGKVFGITSPMVLDLGVFVLTLGLTIKINIANIIGIIISFLLYKLLVR